MAASVRDIMELVWVNRTSSTSPVHHGPPANHKPAAATSATAALKRSRRTRSPVWSDTAPQA
jgi:hypothetical protein